MQIFVISSSHLRFHREHPKYIKKYLKVMPNTTYGMILIFGDSTMTKRPLWIKLDISESPRLCVGFIGPPFFETPMNLFRLVNNVKEQDWPSAKGMNCPNS
ncbi:hypothetical protein CR513_01188, partial [Mucuna pruriens]